jgi:hypothetical protein
LDDRAEAEDDFKRANELASESVRAKAAAAIAEQKARSAQKLLHLRRRVAGLVQERAERDEHRAAIADTEADAAHKQVVEMQREIERLNREARAKSVEADSRVAVAKKLLASAKQMAVDAKVRAFTAVHRSGSRCV